MPTIQIKLIFLWVAVCFGLLQAARFLFRRYPPKTAFSMWCSACAALNMLPIALFFSPTFLMLGGFPFPAPAGLLLIYCAFDSEFQNNNGELIRKNLGFTVICFVGFWLVAWILNLIYRSRKLQNETMSKDFNLFTNKRSIFWICVALIIFIAVLYFCGFRYAQPPRSLPVYQGS